MTKSPLSSEQLLKRGFQEAGCWILNSAQDLGLSIELPSKAGVYAFVIDGVVQYVGLASGSIRKRFGFYRKPGLTQPTNIRLNQLIRGQVEIGTAVQILVAHPPDLEWNGFKIKGAEGLEAGLIEQFNLSWNKRGATRITPKEQSTAGHTQRKRTAGVSDRIVDLVRRRPGLTELEIAKAIHGASAVQQQVNQQCRALVKAEKIERRGTGGAADPFSYWPSSP